MNNMSYTNNMSHTNTNRTVVSPYPLESMNAQGEWDVNPNWGGLAVPVAPNQGNNHNTNNSNNDNNNNDVQMMVANQGGDEENADEENQGDDEWLTVNGEEWTPVNPATAYQEC